MYRLDLTPWETTTKVLEHDENGTPTVVEKKEMYPVRENLSSMLRAQGVFKDTESVVEAITLARMIRDTTENEVSLDRREVQVLKECVDQLLAAAADKRSNFGGEQHEELILRIHALWKSAKE